jgi:hypothetical protein
LTCAFLQLRQAPRIAIQGDRAVMVFGPRPLALGPSAGKLVVARRLDSSANIWRPQALLVSNQ